MEQLSRFSCNIYRVVAVKSHTQLGKSSQKQFSEYDFKAML